MRAMTMSRTVEDKTYQPEIKGLRYHRSDHPHYDSKRYEWKIRGKTKEQIAQELEIDYDTAIVGRVYDMFPANEVEIKYNPELPLYLWIDNSH